MQRHRPHKRVSLAAGFTLIELLVIVLIIGILIAIAAPSFLGQTGKAQDSAAKQKLAVAYRAAKADATSNVPQGEWKSGSALKTVLETSEPGLAPVGLGAGGANNQVMVDEASDATNLSLHTQSASGHICALTAPANESPTTTCNFLTPLDVTPPTISGTPAQDQTLTAVTGAWANAPASYSYQWQDCASGGGSCVDIDGATDSTYALVSADVGNTIRVVVTATNPAGSAAASSVATAVITASGESGVSGVDFGAP